LGETEAATLMEYLPPVGWGDVATKHDLSALEERLEARLEARLGGRIDSLRADVSRDISDLRVEMHDALREQTTRLVTWMIPTWLSAVGIAVAVARLR
jgi:hypothetical protein